MTKHPPRTDAVVSIRIRHNLPMWMDVLSVEEAACAGMTGLAGGLDVWLAVGGDGGFGYSGIFGDAVGADYRAGFSTR